MKKEGTAGKVLVTGASGFIGGHIVTALLDRGYTVSAVYRRRKAPAHLERAQERGCTLINLDLEKTDAGGFFPAGTEIVIHAAALAYDWGSLDLFKRVNTEVTEKL
ncbi:MAG: NAD-dependent epimerase/dehydratase family protein, partial [Spirochaetales bacterium]